MHPPRFLRFSFRYHASLHWSPIISSPPISVSSILSSIDNEDYSTFDPYSDPLCSCPVGTFALQFSAIPSPSFCIPWHDFLLVHFFRRYLSSFAPCALTRGCKVSLCRVTCFAVRDASTFFQFFPFQEQAPACTALMATTYRLLPRSAPEVLSLR